MTQRILVILLALILIITAIMPFLPISFSGQSLFLPTAQAAQDTTGNGPNGDWTASKATYYATDPNHANIGAEMMVRYGDIDNFGAGWGGKDPFTGEIINAPYPTIMHGSSDPAGTDQLMVIKTFINYQKPKNWTSDDSVADGYTRTYYNNNNKSLPGAVPIEMVYNLRDIKVKSAILQLYVNDFQAKKPKDKGWDKYVTYTAYFDGVAAPFISNQINSMNQSGPLGQLLTFNIPVEYLPLLQDGKLSIKLDDDSTTKTPYGDGVAIDFAKLLINPGDYSNVGSISGTVKNTSGKPIAGATVSAMGMAVATTDASGNYQLNKVPFGLVVLEASASGYQTGRIEIPNFKSGYNQPANFVLTAQSNNANLENLVVSSGNPLPLSPSFRNDVTSYTIDLDSNLDRVQVTPTTEDKGATLTVNGVSLPSGTAKEIPLSIGQTVVTIVVTAPNGTTKTYTVTIKTPQLSISRSLAKNTVKANEEATVTYVIEPKPLRADQVTGGGASYLMRNIIYREDLPANVTAGIDPNWTTTAQHTASHIEVKLPDILYTKNGDQYTAPKQTYTMKLKASKEGSYVLDKGQLEYPYLDGSRKTANFDALVFYVEPVVASITLDQKELKMQVGDVYDRLKATVLPANADQRVTWSSSNTSIVTVENGVLTAKGPGTATITVTSADGRISAQCQVTVTQPVKSVAIEPASVELNVGETMKLTAIIQPADASNKNVTWTSSDPQIVTVDSNGTIQGKQRGTVTITVKTEDGGLIAICDVTVVQASNGNATSSSIYAWGANDEGQIGDEKEKVDRYLKPIPVPAFADVEATGIAAGAKHSMAVTKDGYAYTWGRNDQGQLGIGNMGNTWRTEHFPQRLPKQDSNTNFTAVWAGGNHSFAKNALGNVYVWGSNQSGELGAKSANGREKSPLLINSLNPLSKIASGSSHTVAMMGANRVDTAGDNTYGQRGNPGFSGTEQFVQIYKDFTGYTGFTNFKDIAAGDNFALALQNNGIVWGWGDNASGQLTFAETKQTTPRQITALTNVTTMAAGKSHSLAATSDGKVYAWGDNQYGQLGNQASGPKVLTPVEIPALAGKNVVQLAAGDGFSVALTANGDVYTWGLNNQGQLGLGNTTDTKIPTKVPGLGGVKEIAAGNSHVLARGGSLSPVTGVTLDKTRVSVQVNESLQLTATVQPPDAANKNVSWTSADPKIATVDANGKITGIAVGTTTVTVTTEEGNFTATCEVEVKPAPIPVIKVTGVTLDKSSMTMNVNETGQLTATVRPADATDKTVRWSTADSSIATVDADGTVTAKAKGKTTITVTTNDGNYQATCEVTVNEVIPVTGVTLAPTSMTLGIGESQKLTETVSPADATDKTVTWSTADSRIATVDADGLVTAVAPGKTTITVTTNDGHFQATCLVTVVEGETGFRVYLSQSGGVPVRYQDFTFPGPVYVELQFPSGMGNHMYWIDGQQATYTGRFKVEKDGTTEISYYAKPSDVGKDKTTKLITIDKNPFNPANMIKITQINGGSGDLTFSIDLKGTEMEKSDRVSYKIEKGAQLSSVGDGTMVGKGGSAFEAEVHDSFFKNDSKGFYLLTITATRTIEIEDENGNVVDTKTLSQSYHEGFLISPGFELKAAQYADGNLLPLPSDRNTFISSKPITVTLVKTADSFFPAEVAKLSDADKLKFGTLFDQNGDGVIRPGDDWDWGVKSIEYAIVQKGTNIETYSGWKPLTTTQFVITTPNVDWDIYIKTTDNATRWGKIPVTKYTKIQGTFRVNPTNKKL
ncbi:Ig-like domain-containing protein [Brevibacillus fluminis]|uniref:Ig-like domain-containing protein n=1 Tax=Brevibacillus fluminis TaxID=511487 RepID=UPI003F8A62A4